jgi:phosphoglycolate phosphatase
MAIRTVLFDMDGVLIDSREGMSYAWNNVNTRFNLNVEFNDFLNHIGKPFERILTELKISSDQFQAIKFEYGRVVALNTHMICVYRSIPYLIRELKSRGIKTGVVTSKEYWRADRIIDYYVLPVDILICPEHTVEGKPSGEPILRALKGLNEEEKNCLYIGDMDSDHRAAINAGVHYGHASWGYGKPLKGLSPVIFSYPEEILEFIF